MFNFKTSTSAPIKYLLHFLFGEHSGIVETHTYNESKNILMQGNKTEGPLWTAVC